MHGIRSLFIFLQCYHWITCVMENKRKLIKTTIDQLNELCPVSKVVKSKQGILHSYPMDLFDPQQFNLMKDKSQFFHCESLMERIGKSNDPIIRYCSNMTTCPIQHENIDDMLVNSPTNAKHSLCSFKDSLKSQSGRIFAIGGSVTLGGHTAGCQCNNMMQNIIPSNDNCISVDASNEYLSNLYSCPWIFYLGLWLQDISMDHQHRVYNLAQGGNNAKTYSDIFRSILKARNITTFFSSDIIFIDFPVNDDNSPFTMVIEGLESIIRTIYSISDVSSWPTIIMLEGSPNMHKEASSAIHFISEYYSLPFWNFHYMIRSNFSTSSLLMRPFLELLQFKQQHDVHPGWYNHLYYSDILVALLNHEMVLCIPSNHGIQSKHTRSKEEMKLSLYKEIIASNCRENFPLIVDVSSCNPKEENLKLNVTRIPTTSWKFGEDVPGKPGWIDDDNITVNGLCMKPYFEPNLRGDVHYSSEISFPFNIVVLKASINKNISESDHRYVLQLSYLTSYVNTGKFDIFICNGYIATINTHSRKKVSILETHKLIFNYFDYCEVRRSIKVRTLFDKTTNSHLEKNPSITIRRHCPKNETRNELPNSKFKVKLTGLKLCVI